MNLKDEIRYWLYSGMSRETFVNKLAGFLKQESNLTEEEVANQMETFFLHSNEVGQRA